MTCLTLTPMKTYQNQFGESVTKWQSTKHPTNPDFMQVVEYMHITKPNGSTVLCWHLNQSSKVYHIWGISLEDAITKFGDDTPISMSEEEFQQWKTNH